MGQQTWAAIHVGNALIALLLGALMLGLRKGTRWHRRVGFAYVASMLVLNLSALNLYGLNGRFNAFHYCALFSLLTLAAGILPALLRRPDHWLPLHYEFMTWSYVGLCAAAVAESAVRIPAAPFWPAVLVGSVLVIACGGWCIQRARPRFLRMFEASLRQPARATLSQGRDQPPR